ncbi:MAG: polysaccharide biosynthesis/export family protein [Saprospiraceae bacterium]
MKKTMRHLLHTTNCLFVSILAGLLLNGCIPQEKLINFQEESAAKFLNAQYVQEAPKIKIQADDILSITVSTFDSTAAKVFNKNITNMGADGSFIGQGYLVAEDGNIEFPVLGKIKVKGLSREAAKDSIRNKLLTYLRDPVVEVRFLNLHISVMGEVNRPGIYTFPDERFTILEALTIAGDMTNYADRANILIIREHEKIREFGKVDLSSSRAFDSQYFYLAQNDVVYVKPLKEKAKLLQDPVSRALAISGVVASLATIIITLNRTP